MRLYSKAKRLYIISPRSSFSSLLSISLWVGWLVDYFSFFRWKEFFFLFFIFYVKQMKSVVCPFRLIVIDCQENSLSLFFFWFFFVIRIFRSSSFLSLRHWKTIQPNKTKESKDSCAWISDSTHNCMQRRVRWTAATWPFSRVINTLVYSTTCTPPPSLFVCLAYFFFPFYFCKCSNHLSLIAELFTAFHTGPEFPVFHASFGIG